MSREKNSSSIRIAMQYTLPGSTSFRNHCPKRTRGPTVGVDVQPKALAISEDPQPTIFIAKAAIMLNDVGLVSHVNLLMNATSPWYRVFKNHSGRSRTALRMPRNKS